MTQTEALAALEAALALPVRRPDAAGNHIADEHARSVAVRRARAAYYVACSVGARVMA